jgi:hypothetical protein
MRGAMVVVLAMCGLACGTDPHELGEARATSSELGVSADTNRTAQVGKPTFAEWKAGMIDTALPDVGCFEATFPVAGWQQVDCAAPEQEWEYNMGGVWGDEYAIRNGSDPTFSSAEAYWA